MVVTGMLINVGNAKVIGFSRTLKAVSTGRLCSLFDSTKLPVQHSGKPVSQTSSCTLYLTTTLYFHNEILGLNPANYCQITALARRCNYCSQCKNHTNRDPKRLTVLFWCMGDYNQLPGWSLSSSLDELHKNQDFYLQLQRWQFGVITKALVTLIKSLFA